MELQLMLMNKSGIATQQIAKMLMEFTPGDQIPSVTVMSEAFGTARGNIQIALQNIKDANAINLHARGHLGTFIDSIDYLRLAEICGRTAVVGVMPLPYSKKYEGLATAIYSTCNTNKFSLHMAFMRGSENRYQNLLEGRYDFCIMSKLAFDYYQKQEQQLNAIADLGPGTYVSAHALFSKNAQGDSWDKKRIGIDLSSADQKSLTEDYFSKENVEYIPLSYNQIIESLESEVIDACIWNQDDVNADGFIMKPLERTKALNDTHAVVVGRKEDVITKRLLKEVLDLPSILEIQKSVERGEILPKY